MTYSGNLFHLPLLITSAITSSIIKKFGGGNNILSSVIVRRLWGIDIYNCIVIIYSSKILSSNAL